MVSIDFIVFSPLSKQSSLSKESLEAGVASLHNWNPLAVQQKASNTNSILFTPSEPFQPLLWDAEGSLGWITALDLGGQSPRTRTVSRRVGELKSIEGRAEGEIGALASNQLTGTRWMDTDQCKAVINFADIYKSS